MATSKAAQKRSISAMTRTFYDITRPHRFGTDTMVFCDDWTRYERQVESEERDHRRFSGGKFGITVADSVSLFTMKNLLEYRVGARKKPAVEMVGHWKLSIFLAWGIWAAWKKEIRAAVPMKAARQWLEDVDYVDLASVER